VRQAVRHARAAGDALRAAKKEVGHGGWTDWLDANFHGSRETARAYMRVSRKWKTLEPQLARGDLTLEEALEALRHRKPPELWEPPGLTPVEKFIRDEVERCLRNARTFVLNKFRSMDDDLIVCLGFSRFHDEGLDDLWWRFVDELRPVAERLAPVLLEYGYRCHRLNVRWPVNTYGSEEPPERKRRSEAVERTLQRRVRKLVNEATLTEAQKAVVRDHLAE
jgi:hypothetical protein